MKKAIFGVCASMAFVSIQMPVYGQTRLHTVKADSTKQDEIYYVGKVTSGVNVRIGAGVNNKKLMVNNKGVSLETGTKVIIMDEVDVSGKTWYHIKFTYGDMELIGYSTSSCIDKTDVTITPTPLPTPSPEPTVTLEPTIVPTTAPDTPVSPVPTMQPTEGESNDSKTPFLLMFGVAGAAIVLVGIYFMLQKKKERSKAETVQVSEKVEKLKNMVISSDEEVIDEKHKLKKGVYVKKSISIQEAVSEYATTSEEINEADDSATKAVVVSESADKKQLRAAIAKLREHDIVIHKYFGKGEVYDNSDVRLIEVRFGQDVRFMNKEQLVNKKLLEITNERRV